MKVGLYTFGGPTRGTGHVFRCVALAQWLERMSIPVELEFELIDWHPDGSAVAQDVVTTRTRYACRVHEEPHLPGHEWDVLVVDRLRVDPGVMRSLKSRARFMVSVDDAGPGRFVADVALNPLYRSHEHAPPDSRLTVDHQGAEFQIIGPAFSQRPGRWQENVTDLLVTQGGADPHGLAARIIEDLEPLLTQHEALVLHVLTGPAFSGEARLEQVLRRLGPRLQRHSNVTDMPALLRGMDLAISAVGVTPFELAAIGLPAVLVTGNAMELETADDIVRTGAAISLGLYGERTGPELRVAVDALMRSPGQRAALRETGLQRLDGRMGGRLADMIEERFSPARAAAR